MWSRDYSYAKSRTIGYTLAVLRTDWQGNPENNILSHIWHLPRLLWVTFSSAVSNAKMCQLVGLIATSVIVTKLLHVLILIDFYSYVRKLSF